MWINNWSKRKVLQKCERKKNDFEVANKKILYAGVIARCGVEILNQTFKRNVEIVPINKSMKTYSISTKDVLHKTYNPHLKNVIETNVNKK